MPPRQLKKKPTQLQIDEYKYKLGYKVFDIQEIDNTTYYIDTNWNLIWDSDVNIVGFIQNNKYVFFTEIDKIIECVKFKIV